VIKQSGPSAWRVLFINNIKTHTRLSPYHGCILCFCISPVGGRRARHGRVSQPPPGRTGFGGAGGGGEGGFLAWLHHRFHFGAHMHIPQRALAPSEAHAPNTHTHTHTNKHTHTQTHTHTHTNTHTHTHTHRRKENKRK
jgi:hypothetical protein